MSKDLITTVQSMYDVLFRGDIKKLLSYFTEHATLAWGPFIFKGKREIEEWTKELLQMFPSIRIINKKMTPYENGVIHDFIIETVNNDQSTGVLPASGTYTFENDKLTTCQIELHDGYVIRRKEDAKRFGIKV